MKRWFVILGLLLFALPVCAADFDFKLSGYTMTNFNVINNNIAYGKNGTTDNREMSEERDWIDNKFVLKPVVSYGENFRLRGEVHLFNTAWGTLDQGLDGSPFSDQIHIEQIESDFIFPYSFVLRVGKFNNLLPWGPNFYFGPEPKPRIELTKSLSEKPGESFVQLYYERTMEWGAIFQQNIYKNGSYDNKQGGGVNAKLKFGSVTLFPMVLVQHDSSYNGVGKSYGDKRGDIMARVSLGMDWRISDFTVQAGIVVENHTDNGAYAKYNSAGDYKNSNYTLPAGILEASWNTSRFTVGLRGAYAGCAEVDTDRPDVYGNTGKLACGFNDMDVSAWNFAVGKTTGYDAMAVISPYFGINIMKGLRLDANVAYYMSTVPSSKYAMVARTNPGKGLGMGQTTTTVPTNVAFYGDVKSTDLARWTQGSSVIAADIYLKYTWETVVRTVFSVGVSLASYNDLAYVNKARPDVFGKYDPSFITAVQGKIHVFF